MRLYVKATKQGLIVDAYRIMAVMIEQELPEEHRADAVSSMVYEASARIRDPVYGCAGAICQLQKQVNDLKAQLARAHAELAASATAFAVAAARTALACPEPHHAIVVAGDPTGWQVRATVRSTHAHGLPLCSKVGPSCQ